MAGQQDTACVPSLSTSSTHDGNVAQWIGVDPDGSKNTDMMNIWEDPPLPVTDGAQAWPFFGSLPPGSRLSDAQLDPLVKAEPGDDTLESVALGPTVSPPPPPMTVIGARPSAEVLENPEEQWACIYSSELGGNVSGPGELTSLSFSIPLASPGIRGQYGKHSHGRQYELKGFPPVTVTMGNVNPGTASKALQSLVISHRVVKSKCTFRLEDQEEFEKNWDEPTELFRGNTTLNKFCTTEVSGKGFRKTDFHVEVAVFSVNASAGGQRKLEFLYTSPPFFVNTRGAKDRAARRAKRHASLAATVALSAAEGTSTMLGTDNPRESVVTHMTAVPGQVDGHITASLLEGLTVDLWSITLHVSPTTAKAGAEMLFVGDQDFPPNVAIKFGVLTLQPVEMIPGQRRVLKLLHIPLYQMASDGLPPQPHLPPNSVPVAITNLDESKFTNSVTFTYTDVVFGNNPLKRPRGDDDDGDDDGDDDDDSKRQRLLDLDNIEAALRSTYQLTEANNHVMRYINAGSGKNHGASRAVGPPSSTTEAASSPRHLGAPRRAFRRAHSDMGGGSDDRMAVDPGSEESSEDGPGKGPVVDFNLVTFSFRLARAVQSRRSDTHAMVQTRVEAILCAHHDGRLDGHDSNGFTLLSIAALRHLNFLAQFLCEIGASPDDPNADGTCAADLVPDRAWFSSHAPLTEHSFYGTVGPILSDSTLVDRLDGMNLNHRTVRRTASSASQNRDTPAQTGHGTTKTIAIPDTIMEEPVSRIAVSSSPSDGSGNPTVTILAPNDSVCSEGAKEGAQRKGDDMFVRRRQRNMSVVGFTPIASNDQPLPGGPGASLYSSQYVMDLCGRNLDNLPEDTGAASSGSDVKKVVGLSHNRLKSFPHFSHPGAVEMLLLNHNKITTVPTEIAEFTKLRKLWLQYNLLSEIPVSLTALTNLRSLYLHHNKLTQLPNEIGNLVHLEKLVLDNNHLSELPDTIGNLKRLTILSATNNELHHVPDTIVNLARLHEIHLTHNQLEDLPPLDALEQLHGVFLEYNCLTALPEGISRVKDIGLSHNDIHDLCGISQLKNIKTLNLDYNQLREVPAEIAVLSGSLESISLQGNRLRDVQNICLVKSLTELDVSANQLVALPADVRAMRSLRTLDISGNPLLCEWEVHPEVQPPVYVPSLMELAARTVTKSRILAQVPEEELTNLLSLEMIEYVNEARKCHVCKGPYFPPLYEVEDRYGVGSIQFTFFANVGGSRVPLSYQLCSTDCRATLQRGYMLRNSRT